MKLIGNLATAVSARAGGRRLAAAALVSWLALAFLAPAPAVAQSRELAPILDRLQRIERDIKTLNIQVSRGGGSQAATEEGTPAAARISVRLTALEDELRAATGKIETVVNQIEQVGLRLDKLIADLDYRLNALETGIRRDGPQVSAAPSPGGVEKVIPGATQPGVLGTISQSELPVPPPEGGEIAAAAPSTAPPPPAATPGILPQGTPRERYDFAFGLLRQADYDRAELALKEFLEAHGDDPLAGNARYWLAESYYVRGQYVKAAESFVAGYQADATGPKAPDMLLKLGMSMASLDKKQEACASFGKLLKDYPQAAARILTKVSFESEKIGCQ